MGPCQPFATELDLCCLEATGSFPDPCLTGGQPLPPNAVENALQGASEMLWAATGRRFGLCEATIRPCRQSTSPCDMPLVEIQPGSFSWGFRQPWLPVLSGGLWTNISCGACGPTCGCTSMCVISLPFPTNSVSEVKVDGVVLDSSEYMLSDRSKLVRLGGECWPTCQDLTLDDDQEGTFSVTLTYGIEPPSLLVQATAELACQFLKACVGAPCQLPQRISSISRQGVTMGFLDSMDYLSQGKTGIYVVDLAIATLNPHGLTRRPGVYSPDVHPKWSR